MKLSDVLAALANNTDLKITLIDSNDTELVIFNAPGHGSIETDITDREVRRIKIDSGTSAKITIEDAQP